MTKTENKMEGEIVYGLFWQVEPDGKIGIYHKGLIEFLQDQGFFYLKTDTSKRLCRMVRKIVEEVDIGDVTRFIYEVIHSDLVPETLAYTATKKGLLNLFVRGVDNYINHPKLRLLPIIELKFHFDTKEECYFYFKNGVAHVNSDNISIGDYTNLKDYIWKRKIKSHSFSLLDSGEPTGEFEIFCFRVCNKEEKRFESLKTIIGYLLHRYWSASNPIIPCLLDETTLGVEEASGGSGKSLICQGLQYVRNVIDIDGKTFDPQGSFAYQRVNMDTEILFVDDLDRRISFESWFSVVTTGLEINQKNKPAFKIPRQQTPKLVLTSNFPIKSIAGRSTERRKIEFECSQYYGELKPADEFGHEFFTDWDDAEFNRMLNFFTRCVQSYLKTGIITPPSTNGELRKLISQIGIDLKDFLDETFCMRNKDRYIKKEMYDDFLKSHTGQRDFYRSPHKFTLKVHKYLDYYHAEYTEIPANKKSIIEIISWGDLPYTEDDTTVSKTHQTLADTTHHYAVVTSPVITNKIPGGQTMSFAEAMAAANNTASADGTGATAEPAK